MTDRGAFVGRAGVAATVGSSPAGGADASAGTGRLEVDDPVLRLLARLADGYDSPAWAEFVRLYGPQLRRWLRPRHLQPADADDVVQDVLVVVLDKLPGFKPVCPHSLRAWLRAILAHRLRAHWRRSSRWPADGRFDGLAAGLADPSGGLSRRWNEQHARQVVDRLLARARATVRPATFEAFRRRALLGEPPETVAGALGVTTNAVSMARWRVLRRLRREAGRLTPVPHQPAASA